MLCVGYCLIIIRDYLSALIFLAFFAGFMFNGRPWPTGRSDR